MKVNEIFFLGIFYKPKRFMILVKETTISMKKNYEKFYFFKKFFFKYNNWKRNFFVNPLNI